jgi:glycosyltransferase involved in cell wall biosynthesis
VKKRLLILCDYYLPGHKGGGGMRLVANLVEHFADRFDISVITRNHDGPADRTPYENVATDEWNATETARVFYASQSALTLKNISRLVTETEPDLVFLNSVFSTPSVLYMTARRLGKTRRIPVVVSPCGELAPALLKRKRAKKKAFLNAAKAFGLYRDAVWRASFADEKAAIEAVFGKDADVLVAPDLLPRSILPEFSIEQKPPKAPGSVKLAFVSRISANKGAHFLLEVLRQITGGDIELDLVGPHEDEQYWQKCLSLLETLPPNVKVTVAGSRPHDEALERMRNAHFFVLPTESENFGYVFVEAMAAGCGLVISDRTAWNDIETNGVGWELSLEDTDVWVNKLKYCVNIEQSEFAVISQKARSHAMKWLNDPGLDEAMEALFAHSLSKESE